jgi:hypothetical protein
LMPTEKIQDNKVWCEISDFGIECVTGSLEWEISRREASRLPSSVAEESRPNWLPGRNLLGDSKSFFFFWPCRSIDRLPIRLDQSYFN